MNSSSGSSVRTFSIPLSVKNQTKEKFDALLKTAIQKKKSRALSVSKEKLIDDVESSIASSENLLYKDKTEDIELHDLNNQINENYILNKFLGHQNKDKNNVNYSSEEVHKNSVTVKPPVPKPRTKKCASTISQGTFEVISPKIIKNQSPDSNKTYNVEEIGDVLVHDTPSKSKIIKKTAYTKRLRENSVINSDDELKSSESENESSKSEQIVQLAEAKDLREVVKESPTDTSKNKKSVKEKYDTEEKIESNLTSNFNYDKIIEIIIHKTDRLELSSLVVHPVVKIHVVEATTGKYYAKSDTTRSVVFFYENNDNDYISPVMTHACNLQEKRILYPSWEESILLNEDFEYFKSESSHLMIFFEVLDFLSYSMLQQLNEKECTSGWHSIAFAFLKVASKNNTLNIGKKVRLQLYYPHQSKKYNIQKCNPWVWWKKKKLKKYPSTLYVTIKSITSPTKVVESFRSKTPIQRESSSKTKLCDDSQNFLISNSEVVKAESKVSISESKTEVSNWSRRPNEICKLPNKCLVEFCSYDQGCFVLKFSHDGNYLACAVQIESLFYIIIYSIQSLREVNKFCCHQSLIYSIKWSSDDSLLLSASADNTISIFQISASSYFQILPHPSFVYSCDINEEKIIASGCYDGIIRIWNENESKTEFRLFQELEGHSGYVTTLCFNKKSSIFSADSIGVIIEWQLERVDWILKRHINLLDLRETVINHMILFSKERKLLVHSRDSVIRIMDVKSGCVLQWLRGSLNKRFQIFSTISACGNYVFSGGENGIIHVWNVKNGNEIATYIPYDTKSQFLSIHSVDFHPHDNILAISHYGKNLPILLYNYDHTLQQPSINLVVKELSLNNNTKSSKLDITFRDVIRKNNAVKNEEKIDFKGVLQKMDLVIMSQKANR